jgi:Allene oxide cyclase barrel like domain
MLRRGAGPSVAIMRISPHKLAAAALAAAAATGAVALGHTTASATDGARTIVFTEPFVGGHNRYLDLGRKGISPGDMFLSTDVPIHDASGKRVGSSDGMETIVSGRHDGTVMLQGAARLRDGRIELAALLRHSDEQQTGIVTGGTGAYAGARGYATVVEDRKHKRNITTLTLLP